MENNTIPFADALKAEDNVDVIAIGVTSAINKDILRDLSSYPHQQNKVSTKDLIMTVFCFHFYKRLNPIGTNKT